jgi:hypothetical protein
VITIQVPVDQALVEQVDGDAELLVEAERAAQVEFLGDDGVQC